MKEEMEQIKREDIKTFSDGRVALKEERRVEGKLKVFNESKNPKDWVLTDPMFSSMTQAINLLKVLECLQPHEADKAMKRLLKRYRHDQKIIEKLKEQYDVTIEGGPKPIPGVLQ